MKCSPETEVYGVPVSGLSVYLQHGCNRQAVLLVGGY